MLIQESQIASSIGIIGADIADFIERLQAGTCSIELGFILSDLLSNYERISDHCSNLAACLIQTQHASFGTHNYLDEIKTGNQPNFVSAYQMYSQKYRLA